jgi:FixJ family two-component response regulator
VAARHYIAIIDDDESMCRSLSRLLQQVGLRSITFSRAEEFLADAVSERCACLLLDVHLPGISGIDLHRELIARGVLIPVIYITAYDDVATRAEASSIGCAGFFRKSDPGPDIIAAIRRVIGTGAWKL